MATSEVFWYSPGEFTAVCGGGIAVLLDLPPENELVSRIFDVVRLSGDVDDILDVLVSPGLKAVKGFAIAQRVPHGARVVLRGGFVGAVTGNAENVVAASPWTDRFIEEGDGVVLSHSAEDAGFVMPLALAVVRAGAILVQQPVPKHGAPAPQPETEMNDPVPNLAPVKPAPQPLYPEPAEVRAGVPGGQHREPPQAIEPALAAGGEIRPEISGAEDDRDEPFFLRMFAPDPAQLPPPHVGSTPAGTLIEDLPWALGDSPGFTHAAPPHAAAPHAGAPLGPPALQSMSIPAPGRPLAPGFDAEAGELTVNRSNLIGQGAAKGPTVLAARCRNGHLSPAYAVTCRVCREPMPSQQAFEIPRPPLGVLRLSTGDLVALDRGAILGRSPRLPPGFTGEQPNLVRLNDPGRDVSSQHLEVILDYWHVSIKDLGSTNGTEVILPGAEPMQLRVSDPVTIEPGTRVVLAGVLEFTFEVSE